MVARKRGLGRGLDALLGADSRVQADGAVAAVGQRLDEVPVEWIRPGKYQPRKIMDEEALQELASSIKAHGLMQPIVLRSVSDNRYEIIAGERRWRAAQLAGMERVPAVIKEVNDEAAMAMSLIENIQREDLSTMEEALALQRLVEDFELTHQQVADAVGKSRATVTNFLRLTHLSSEVAQMLGNGDIDMGHARALLSLSSDLQGRAARDIVAQHLNVRQAEALVRRMLAEPKVEISRRAVDTDTRQLESRLTDKLGQPVSIQHTTKGKGKLVIKYNSLDELEGVLARFDRLE